jgi:hypothetical protein
MSRVTFRAEEFTMTLEGFPQSRRRLRRVEDRPRNLPLAFDRKPNDFGLLDGAAAASFGKRASIQSRQGEFRRTMIAIVRPERFC